MALYATDNLTHTSPCLYKPLVGIKNAIDYRAIAPPEGGENGELSPPSALQLTEKQFRNLLINLSHQAGSMAELARRLDITGQYMGEIISGKKRPGPKLLRKLSAKAITTYEITVEAETNGHK